MEDNTDLLRDIKEHLSEAKKFIEIGDYDKGAKYYKMAGEKTYRLYKRETIDSMLKETYKQRATQYLNKAKELKNIKKIPIEANNIKDPDSKLKEQLAGCLVSDKPNVKWDDVAGLHAAKATLKEAVILPIKFPQLFKEKRKLKQ